MLEIVTRRRISRVVAAGLGLLAALATRAQEAAPSDGLEAPPPIPTEGFWPTRLMLERFLDRICDEIVEKYDMDDDQHARMSDLLHERFPAWMSTNRAEIQTLMNEFFEAQLDDQPPVPEDVALWAERVLPLLEGFGDLGEGLTDSMREFLTDDQQVLLDAEFAAFQAGVGLATNKMRAWAAGGYDPQRDWSPHGRARREREREENREVEAAMEAARQESLEHSGATSAPADADPPDEWAQYVDAFIARYELSVEQRQRAVAYLRIKQRDRDTYLKRTAPELERVEKLLASAEGEPAQQAAQEAWDRVNAPVDRMFQQLKDKLDTIPTRAQRRAAAQRAMKQEEAATQPATSQGAEAREDGGGAP